MKWLIYKITNKTTNKSYIGLTSTTLKKRWKQHLVRAFTANDQRNGKFQNALRLYGADDWSHAILEKGIKTLNEANLTEKKYIVKYDAFENGYNLTIGGEGTIGLKGKLSPHYGKKKSAYVIECLKRPRGNMHTKESMAKRKATRRANLTKYWFYHEIHGKKLFSSVELSEKYNIQVSQVNTVIKGKNNQCKGWRIVTKPKKEGNSA